MRFLYLLVLLLVLLSSCSTSKTIVHPETEVKIVEVIKTDTVYINAPPTQLATSIDTIEIKGLLQRKVYSRLVDSRILSTGFSGLMVYDLDVDTFVMGYNSKKYFTAASNTKLFTLFTCLQTMHDSILSLRYVETDSTFTFWGCADPTFLHPYFNNDRTLTFLKRKAKNKKLIMVTANNLKPYGPGWMWDDYNESYQAEITAFPMYGNVTTISNEKYKLSFSPDIFIKDTSYNKKIGFVKRSPYSNQLELPKTLSNHRSFKQEVPYKFASSVNHRLLEQLIGYSIDTVSLKLPFNAARFYSIPKDTVLRRMMIESDNMLAEHLLLSASMENLDTLSTLQFIPALKETLLSPLPQNVFWFDGSGLSRYNRFTPESIISLLKQLYISNKSEELFSYLKKIPVNIKDNGGFIYGKSGSMSGVYNLSGYIKTPSGKTLSFSFMNNNFSYKSSGAKKEVLDILKVIALEFP